MAGKERRTPEENTGAENTREGVLHPPVPRLKHENKGGELVGVGDDVGDAEEVWLRDGLGV